MTLPARAPWHPDRRWADPLIALLILLAVLVAGLALGARGRAAARPAHRVSLQGRLLEVSLAGPRLLAPARKAAWGPALRQAHEPWDRAMVALLQAELGDSSEPLQTWVAAASPEGPGGEAFRQGALAAFGGGPLPEPALRRALHHHLGGGYTADLLEARLRDREGTGGQSLRTQAGQRLVWQAAALALGGLALLTLAAGGLAVGGYLWTARTRPVPPLPTWELSGRAAALVGLLWFLVFFLSGNLALLLVQPWPTLRWLALPMGYLLHAGFGVWLLALAEGVAPSALWRRLSPGRPGRDLAWAAAFLALAVALVLAVALLSNLVLQPDQSPQRDLQELLRGLRGWLPSLALCFTVAVLAPAFEELLFRGLLLPVLARRLPFPGALLASSLLFGAIHLQPQGLPVLGTLGLVLGLALRQSGSLRTPVLVHAAWNGSLFLLMRAFG